jgi:hypothetical protein
MNFSLAYPTALKADLGNAFKLTPPAGTILFLNSHDIPDFTTDGYSFDLIDFTDNFEVHNGLYQLDWRLSRAIEHYEREFLHTPIAFVYNRIPACSDLLE